MKSLAVICFLSLIAIVYTQNYAQIATFEGTYNDPFYGGKLYLCQNGNLLQGSYSQAGMIIGTVANGTATGKYFQAGNNQCNIGKFTWQLTDEGFTGTYTCNGISGTFPWVAKKYDVFRPSDENCALLHEGNNNVIGHWRNEVEPGYYIDICNRTAKSGDNSTIHASYDTYNEGSYYPNQGYISGHSVFNSKIFVGTWYEDFEGGAVLGYINIREELVLWYWTGLAGRQGGSILDASEYNVPDYHWVTRYSHSLRTSAVQCDRFIYLQDYVLDGLYYYQNYLGYIYFAYDPYLLLNTNVGFAAINYQYGQYLLDLLYDGNYNSSSTMSLSVLAVIVSILVSLF